jgi:hypothetical protein
MCTCPLGRYLKTADECALCPAGTASETPDATACTCPVLRYWATPDECSVCPEGKSSYAVDASECVCPAGSFDATDSACVECPLAGEATDCNNIGPGVSIATLPVKANFWRTTPNSTTVMRCYTANVCIGASTAQVRKSNASNVRALQSVGSLLDSAVTYGDGLCLLGHTGPFCEQCAANYYKNPDGTCNRCNESDGNVVLAFALPITLVIGVIVAGLAVACRARKKAIAMALDKLESDARDQGAEIDKASYSTGTAKESWDVAVYGKIYFSLIQVLSQMKNIFEIRFPVRGSISIRRPPGRAHALATLPLPLLPAHPEASDPAPSSTDILRVDAALAWTDPARPLHADAARLPLPSQLPHDPSHAHTHPARDHGQPRGFWCPRVSQGGQKE